MYVSYHHLLSKSTLHILYIIIIIHTAKGRIFAVNEFSDSIEMFELPMSHIAGVAQIVGTSSLQ